MTRVTIPQSLQFYYQSPENGNAIEALASKTHTGARHIPIGLDWSDLEAFHRAVLAAHQTQVDGWCFLKLVWEQVWQPVLADTEFGGECVAFTIGEYSKNELSVDYAWSEGFYQCLSVRGGMLCTSSHLTENSVRIAFYYENALGEYADSNGLKLNKKIWELDASDETQWSKPELAFMSGLTTLDLHPLKEAANEAATALAACLNVKEP